MENKIEKNYQICEIDDLTRIKYILLVNENLKGIKVNEKTKKRWAKTK